ncbi:MAG: hypothetical protein N2043_02095 [Ignavibacterium sp.]|nr:hypothetical protein [Ignavibacterium sp.]
MIDKHQIHVDMTEIKLEKERKKDPHHIKFSKHLEKIQQKLPFWSKMKKDKYSIGALFLNIFGLEFDDVEFILNYAFNQLYIEKANVNQVHGVYKSILPNTITPNHVLFVRGEIYDLEEAKNMIDFLTGLPDDGLIHREIFYNNPYYIDWEKQTIYVRKPYDSTKEEPDGKITIEVYNNSGLLENTYNLPLMYHHVWNFFDDFGFLLNTPRLHKESNESYKNRLLDVFRHPANSGKVGLKNGIARELSLVKRQKWKNTTEPLYLKHQRIDINTIEVNGEKVDQSYIKKTKRGRYVIYPIPTLYEEEVEVSYVCGLDIHELHDKEDIVLQSELFTPEKTATPKLEYYVQQILDQVPIYWGHFKWDEGYWDIANENMSGYGVIPSYYDASFMEWKNYKKEGDKK